MVVTKKICEELVKKNKWAPALCLLCRNHNSCPKRAKLTEEYKNDKKFTTI